MTIDFNTYADAYQRNRSVHPGVLAALLAGSNPWAGDAVLEIGCGTANYLAAIVAESGAAGVGLDPAKRMLEEGRTHPEANTLRLVEGSAESLPFPNGSFRFVFSVDVIHHVQDRVTAAAEAFRVLAAGGRICIATDSHDDIAGRVPLSSHFPETIAHELKRYPPVATLLSEFDSAGFRDMSCAQVAHEYQLTDITPYRERAFSALRLITDTELAAGLASLERDLANGPIPARSLYTLIWATRP